MKLLHWITLRGLATRRLRSVLTLLGIMLGIAAMFSINDVNRNAFAAINRLFEGTSGKVQLEIRGAQGTGDLALDLLEEVEGHPGILSVHPVLEVTAARPQAGQEELDLGFLGMGTEGLLFYGVDLDTEGAVRDYVLLEGRMPQRDGAMPQVVITAAYAAEENLRVGEVFRVLTTAGPVDLAISGLLAKEGVGLLNGGRMGVLALAAAQEAFQRQGRMDRLDLRVALASDPSALETLREELQTMLGARYTVGYPGGQGEQMSQMLSGYQISLNFMAGIALFVGAFLIYNALSMTVSERTREMGLLRCVGMTRGQIMGQVLFEGLLLGALGGLFGAGLGLLLSRQLTALMGALLGQPLTVGGIPWDLLLLSVLLGMAVTLLSAVIPAVIAGGTPPLAALRKGRKAKESWIHRRGWMGGVLLLALSTGILIWNPFPYDVQFRLGSLTVFSLFFGATLIIPATLSLWQRLTRGLMKLLFGVMGALGARNLERSPRRTMLTCAALMVGVSMIVSTQGITGAFTKDLYAWMEAYMGGDLYVTSPVLLPGSLKEDMEALPEIRTAAPVRMLEALWLTEAGEEPILFMGVDPATYTDVTRFLFRGEGTEEAAALQALDQGGAVFISEAHAVLHGLEVGDSLRIRTKAGETAYRVAGIVLDFSNQGLVVTANLKDLEKDFDARERTSFSLAVAEGTAVGDALAAVKARFSSEYPLVVESNEALFARAEGLMTQAFRMFDVLGVLAVLVAALGVLNTLTMSVVERTREIGMLRAMGMTRTQVVRMVLAEAGLMGLIGGILGLGFGLLLTWILLAAMGAMSGYALDFVFPTRALWQSILVALVTAQLAGFLPARRAARTPMLSAIRYE